jgi:hypothetical protein
MGDHRYRAATTAFYTAYPNDSGAQLMYRQAFSRTIILEGFNVELGIPATETLLTELLQPFSYYHLSVTGRVISLQPEIVADITVSESDTETIGKILTKFNGHYFKELGVFLTAHLYVFGAT